MERQGRILVRCVRGVRHVLHRQDFSGHCNHKLTSTRYGAKDFVFSNDGKRLYFSRLDNLGYDLRYSGTEELSRSEAVLSKDGSSPIAKELTLQEARIAEQLDEPDTVISSPVKYRKGLHLFRLHSWAPVYCDIENFPTSAGRSCTTMCP